MRRDKPPVALPLDNRSLNLSSISAEALGVTFPPGLLVIADRVIE